MAFDWCRQYQGTGLRRDRTFFFYFLCFVSSLFSPSYAVEMDDMLYRRLVSLGLLFVVVSSSLLYWSCLYYCYILTLPFTPSCLKI